MTYETVSIDLPEGDRLITIANKVIGADEELIAEVKADFTNTNEIIANLVLCVAIGQILTERIYEEEVELKQQSFDFS